MGNLVSYRKTALIEIYLNNGTGFDNAEHGITDGVMYLTDGDVSVDYDSNIYKTTSIFKIGPASNSFDPMNDIGGYKPYNAFSFQIDDSGLSQLLLDQGISIALSQVKFTIMIDSSIYETYYGVITNPGTTGEKLKIKCGDVANLKERLTLPPTVLGRLSPDITNRVSDFTDVSATVTDANYYFIFPGSTGNPSSTGKSHYDANTNLYQSTVLDVGTFIGPTGDTAFQYIVMQVENTVTIDSNPNYLDRDAYLRLAANYNIEILDENNQVIGIYHILNINFIYSGVGEDEAQFRVYEDTASLVPFKTRCRLGRAKSSITYSEYSVELDPIMENSVDLTPLYEQVSNESFKFGKPGFVSPISGVTNDYEYGTDAGQVNVSVNVPDEVFVFTYSDDFAITLEQTQINKEDQNFAFGQGVRVASYIVDGGSGDDNEITMAFNLPSEYMNNKEWSIGWNIMLSSIIGTSQLIDPVSVKFYTQTSQGKDYLLSDLGTLSLTNTRPYEPTTDESRLGVAPYLYQSSKSGFVTLAVNNPGLKDLFSQKEVSGFLRMELTFNLRITDDPSQGDIYVESFFMYRDEMTNINQVSIASTNGASWENDPKYTPGGFGLGYPLTRTGVSRYILDLAANYNETTDYDNDIIDDSDTQGIYYTNHDKQDLTCTQLIDDVLSDSIYTLLGTMTGKRRMFNAKNLVAELVPISRAFVGSAGGVAVNGFYNKIYNQYDVEFDGSAEYSVKYNQILDLIASVSDVELNDDSALITQLTESAGFNNLSEIKSLKYPYTNFNSGGKSSVFEEVARIADVYGWSHVKYSRTEDMKVHMENPVYIGDFVTFQDLRYTANAVIYGAITGVSVDYEASTVTHTILSLVSKPLISVLIEQFGGINLSEHIGGIDLNENAP